ncbi:uncharacterized protein LOC143219228 [Lasioglossum baleicum]|uniref:uncharacterized protein LOC143219228 n=1 Tax=Lasioglossum baleicum TaxID=434251 RepID=UPI003FCC6FC2
MHALIPLIAGLSLVSGAQFNLPYVICPGCQLLVDQQYQYQNTRTGEHAYSYAGGPSAKEEIKGADGVVRGSYSYVDAYGVPQSVFYVADDYGFRVAATDLPTDNNPSPSSANPVLLVRIQKPEEQSKSEEPAKPSRAKRSLDIGENQSEKKLGDVASVKTILAPEATLVHGLPFSTSHQSQVQIHKGVSVDPILAKPLLKLEPQAFYQPLILHSEIPLATSHQSQVQIHNNANVKLSGVEDADKDKPIDVLSLPQILHAPSLYESLTPLSLLPSYHENRIELHKQLGIEGAKLKNTVKINTEPLALVESPALVAEKAVPVLHQATLPQVIAKEAIVPATTSVTASISEHGISQIHPSAKVVQPLAVPSLSYVENAAPVVPVVNEPVPAGKLATATVTTSVSSHGVSQIHGASKITAEPIPLLKTVPLAQVHVFAEPVYLR